MRIVTAHPLALRAYQTPCGYRPLSGNRSGYGCARSRQWPAPAPNPAGCCRTATKRCSTASSIAVAAAEQERQHVIRQILDRVLDGIQRDWIGLAGSRMIKSADMLMQSLGATIRVQTLPKGSVNCRAGTGGSKVITSGVTGPQHARDER